LKKKTNFVEPVQQIIRDLNIFLAPRDFFFIDFAAENSKKKIGEDGLFK
jgi:hypothetical protein